MDDIYYNASLYIINADGSGLIQINTLPGGDFDPAWSPDGKKIAFASLRTGQIEIFTASLDDLTAPIQITKNTTSMNSRQPAWSPDGTHIVYTLKRFGVNQIWLMNADGSEPIQIVRSGIEFTDYFPVWSRDGSRIIFNQRCATKFCNPYLMSISATDHSVQQATRLELNVTPIENVDYSPDGSLIVYEGSVSGSNNDIFYMNMENLERVRITTDPSPDFNPAWRPIP
jgi:Tol biopolymer transport system component